VLVQPPQVMARHNVQSTPHVYACAWCGARVRREILNREMMARTTFLAAAAVLLLALPSAHACVHLMGESLDSVVGARRSTLQLVGGLLAQSESFLSSAHSAAHDNACGCANNPYDVA
jgi:hypothetical protein